MRDQAILLVMLDAALCVLELTSLDLDQYEGKHFKNVKRKGNHVTDRVFVASSTGGARPLLPKIRGRRCGAAFSIESARRLAPKNIADALDSIVAQANTRLSDSGADSPDTACARHTALRKMAETKGIRYAQQMAGPPPRNTSGGTLSRPAPRWNRRWNNPSTEPPHAICRRTTRWTTKHANTSRPSSPVMKTVREGKWDSLSVMLPGSTSSGPYLAIARLLV